MRLSASFVVLLIPLAAVTLWGPPLHATSYIGSPPDMEECVRGAGRIFAGTLSQERSYRTEETILTEYRFKDVVWVRGGDGSDSASVTMRGGSYGGQTIRVEGSPKLEVGKRFVVFAPTAEQSERNHHFLSIKPRCLCRVLDVDRLRDIVTPTGWTKRRFGTEKDLLRALRSLLTSDR